MSATSRIRHSQLIRAGLVIALSTAIAGAPAHAQSPIEYRLSFPDAIHHVMQVEATFPDVPPGPLRVEMSRSSPGRYSAFEFAKNVFEVQFTDGHGHALSATQPNPRSWRVTPHDGVVHVSYRLFGDQVDGTFVAIDSTHAHLNFPASLMWARGMANRPARVTFVLPPGSDWKIATQLYPTRDPLTFAAPNLQYLMDSPVELSNFVLRTFTVPPLAPGGKPQTIRIAMHSRASDADLGAYTAAFEKVVREEQAVFGELPDFEAGSYTLLADYLPWDNFDGMEHRNSSSISSSGNLLRDGIPLVGNPAHEFFHVWNVKRLRPASLEPFDFTDANMSGELWLAEGFTNYYGRLMLMRSGIRPDLAGFGTQLAGELGYVLSSPGRRFRSAVDMSRLAPFVDSKGPSSEPTDWPNTLISYYSFGDMIALGLDLELRARSDSRVSLDDFMRAMWRAHGKPGGPAPGLVGKPYTLADVQARLAEVSGDQAFAADFMRRYVEGTERMDYAPLLLRAGFVMRKKYPERGWLGNLVLDKKKDESTLRVISPTVVGTPAYEAGLDLDDELLSVAGVTLSAPDDLAKALAERKAGDVVELVFRRRDQELHATAKLVGDPQLEIVPIEKTGGTFTTEQKHFRDAWLNSKIAAR